MRWWTDALELINFITLVGAVIVLAKALRSGPLLGVAAGLAMIAETVMCPSSNHHQVGWWLWLQAALSGFVLLCALGLLAAEHRTRRKAAASVG